MQPLIITRTDCPSWAKTPTAKGLWTRVIMRKKIVLFVVASIINVLSPLTEYCYNILQHLFLVQMSVIIKYFLSFLAPFSFCRQKHLHGCKLAYFMDGYLHIYRYILVLNAHACFLFIFIFVLVAFLDPLIPPWVSYDGFMH